jgi:hypothetical protein
VAEEILEELKLEATLVSGAKGEFSVRLAGEILIEKSGDNFPTPGQCVDAVRAAHR